MSYIRAILPQAVRHRVKTALLALGIEAKLRNSDHLIRPAKEDAEFGPLWQSCQSRAIVEAERCYVLHRLAKQSRAVPGALAEVGVYRGGTAYILARTRPDARIYLFDTFEGMPTVDPALDLHRQGDFGDTSIGAVQEFVGTENAIFVKGVFPESARGLEHERFALVHADCDIYSSVRACCEWFYPRLVRGGVLVFDDYGQLTCPGAKRAVDEFFAKRPEVPILVGEGQALVFKLTE